MAATTATDHLRFLICGSVDDGKSTLIGRLIAEATVLPQDQLDFLRVQSRRFGTVGNQIDYALLTDGLEAEREQGITIDVAYRFFATSSRAFIVADAPGHAQYTCNMATGASTAELAVLLVDARHGLVEQTRRHAAIISMLGIRHVILAVNKMDLVDFDDACFRKVEDRFRRFAQPLNFASICAVPIAARFGENLTQPSARMPWHQHGSLLSMLERADVQPTAASAPFRLPVQLVTRPSPEVRGLAGTIAAGTIVLGDRVVVAETGIESAVSRIVTSEGDVSSASEGRAVTVVLADPIDVPRGYVLSRPDSRPTVTRRIVANVIWVGDSPASPGRSFQLKLGTATTTATLTRVVGVTSLEDMQLQPASDLKVNDVGQIELECVLPVSIDPFGECSRTGAFILTERDSRDTACIGMVLGSLDRSTNVHLQAYDVTTTVRANLNHQRPLVVWFTGLPASGKSTVANIVERMLVEEGKHTILLDGDNLRHGLNADLGFDANARAENVRRVGEVAKIVHDAGLIVLVALVSPFRDGRDRVRSLLPEGQFVEVFVDAPLEVCRRRDPKGLYARAAAGKVKDVTGRDQQYEPPRSPELVLKTAQVSAEEAALRVVHLVLERTGM